MVSETPMWFSSIVANTVYIYFVISCLSLPQEGGSSWRAETCVYLFLASVSGKVRAHSGHSANTRWTNKSLLIKENCFFAIIHSTFCWGTRPFPKESILWCVLDQLPVKKYLLAAIWRIIKEIVQMDQRFIHDKMKPLKPYDRILI